jgi:hypothetical protein
VGIGGRPPRAPVPWNRAAPPPGPRSWHASCYKNSLSFMVASAATPTEVRSAGSDSGHRIEEC